MSACCICYEHFVYLMYTPYEGLDGMLLERNGKLTIWKSRLSYSLVESLPPHKYLMPVMIDFFLIRWRSSFAKRSGCKFIKPQLSMKQLYFHTSWCYNERKSIIFALSATLASFA